MRTLKSAVLAVNCVVLMSAALGFARERTVEPWSKSDEDALRELISKSGVELATFLNANGLPYKALCVPEEFVTLYRKSPRDCLSVLMEIVEGGTPHDAKVAFQFGRAGDEPQIAMPLFAYASEREYVGNASQSYRKMSVALLRKKLLDQQNPQQPTDQRPAGETSVTKQQTTR
jgi:hypothetical protein